MGHLGPGLVVYPWLGSFPLWGSPSPSRSGEHWNRWFLNVEGAGGSGVAGRGNSMSKVLEVKCQAVGVEGVRP